MDTTNNASERASDAAEMIIGQPLAGGFYAGRIRDGGRLFALVVAPKATGETKAAWSESEFRVDGAGSFSDGAANTAAMSAAGSSLGKWALELSIGGFADWHIPAMDELEVIYRNLKPSTDENALYARSGINVAAEPPTLPYTATTPAQTQAPAFQLGGAESFEKAWYWSSTQRAANSDYAWGQSFDYGFQGNDRESYEGRARAVRRFPI